MSQQLLSQLLQGPAAARDAVDQFTSILGDLLHKQDLYMFFLDFGPDVEKFFSNKSQAKYLRLVYPDLVPKPDPSGNEPSDHTLGTIFELHYYSELSFRMAYLKMIRTKPLWCFV